MEGIRFKAVQRKRSLKSRSNSQSQIEPKVGPGDNSNNKLQKNQSLDKKKAVSNKQQTVPIKQQQMQER